MSGGISGAISQCLPIKIRRLLPILDGFRGVARGLSLLKKKLGLTITSKKIDGRRVYRIVE